MWVKLALLAFLLLLPCSSTSGPSNNDLDLDLDLDAASARPLTWYFSRFSARPSSEHLELLHKIGLPFAILKDGQVAILLYQEEEEEQEATPAVSTQVRLSATPFCPKEEELEEETKAKYSQWHLKLG